MSKSLHFRFTPINYIIPYSLSIGAIFGALKLMDNLNVASILGIKEVVLLFSVLYIVYSVTMVVRFKKSAGMRFE